MALQFSAGDDLIFQLESGFGLIRVLAVETGEQGRIWHVLIYEDFYPDVETAEAAIARGGPFGVRRAHLALTEHAFEKTPAARLGNRPVRDDELAAYREWAARGGQEVSDRSILLMLGMR